jgi:signal transduction histidine kinase
MTPQMDSTYVATGTAPLSRGADPGPENQPHGSSTLASAGVVHDLGNLIQIAASAVNIVARSGNMQPTETGAILGRAKTSLEQAGALVRQTLRLLRGPALAVGDSSVTACLADVAALVGAINQSGLSLEVDVEPDLPAVRCDPLALRNAVLNLVFNARDAMAGEGTLVIAGRFNANGGGVRQVEIVVTDQGVGMTAATIERAFDPFFTTKADGLGGVGLPMVERFVRESGGEILIQSELGKGTSVTIRLPAATHIPPEKEVFR